MVNPFEENWQDIVSQYVKICLKFYMVIWHLPEKKRITIAFFIILRKKVKIITKINCITMHEMTLLL